MLQKKKISEKLMCELPGSRSEFISVTYVCALNPKRVYMTGETSLGSVPAVWFFSPLQKSLQTGSESPNLNGAYFAADCLVPTRY